MNSKKISPPPPPLPSRRIVIASLRVHLFRWLLHFCAVSRCSRCPVALLRRIATPCCAALHRHVVTTHLLVVSLYYLVVALRPLTHLITPALFGWLLRRCAAPRPCFPSRVSSSRLAIVSLLLSCCILSRRHIMSCHHVPSNSILLSGLV